MDQRPGQNVDLGLYFHMEGPVSPKHNAKKSKFGRKKSGNFGVLGSVLQSSHRGSLRQGFPLGRLLRGQTFDSCCQESFRNLEN